MSVSTANNKPEQGKYCKHLKWIKKSYYCVTGQKQNIFITLISSFSGTTWDYLHQTIRTKPTGNIFI